jgi:2-oxoglutarate dehydrogenase E2 component (dihydrolipoamide succinyltransferase)
VKVGAPLFRVRGGDKPAGAPAAAAAPAPVPAAPAPAPAAAAPTAASAPKAAPAPAAAAPAPAPKAAAPAAAAGGAGKPAKEAAAPLKVAPPVVGARTESRVAMSRMRQRIAQRLKDSQNTAAMLTTFQEVRREHTQGRRGKGGGGGREMGYARGWPRPAVAARRRQLAVVLVTEATCRALPTPRSAT